MFLSHIVPQELDFIMFAFSLNHLHTHRHRCKALGSKKPIKFALEYSVPFLYLIHLLNCRTLTAGLCIPKFFLSDITAESFFHILACGSAEWFYNTAKHHSAFW